jgi:hypothetical protein
MKTRGIRTWLAAAALAALLAPSVPRIARAAEAVPGFLAKELVPGRADVLKLTLRTSLPTERVTVQPVNVSMNRAGDLEFGEEIKDKRLSAAAWCKLRPADLTLQLGRDQEIDVPMLVPPGTPGGEYYLGIQVHSRENEAPRQQDVSVKLEVNLVVLAIIRVAGSTPRIAGEILDAAVSLKGALPEFRSTFHSLSTVAIVSRTGVIVRDADQKVFDRALLKGAGSQQKDGQAFLFPDGLRDFTGVGNRRLPPGRYTAEFVSVFGSSKIRASKTVEFEVKESGGTPPRPIEDIRVEPGGFILELPAGGIKYPIVEIKNRGFNAVDLSLSGPAGLGFFPDKVRVEPGKGVKVRIAVRIPPTENPRRDLQVILALDGGAENDKTSFPIRVYAPGTIPREVLQEIDDKNKPKLDVPQAPAEAEPVDPKAEKKP